MSMRSHPSRKRACAVRAGAARTSSGAAPAAPELDGAQVRIERMVHAG